jgi:hypothetical protein
MLSSSDDDAQTPLVTFARSIRREVTGGLRRNKIPAVLASFALVVTTLLAINSSYDERPRYREVLLPDIERAEGLFLDSLHDAETTDNEEWRIRYFMIANAHARVALDIAKRHWPQTRDAVRAHEELVRYYELVVEDFAIIRTQLSLDDKMDFMAAWHKCQAERWPVHERWANWVRAHP